MYHRASIRCLLALAATLPVLSAPAPAPITTISQALKLTHEQAALNPPARIVAIVTEILPEQYLMMVEQDHAGIYVPVRPEETFPVDRGDLVELTGVIEPGGFSNSLAATKCQILRKNVPLPVEKATFPQLIEGRFGNRRVLAEGVVISVEANVEAPHSTTDAWSLRLSEDGSEVDVRIPQPLHFDVPKLLGTRIRITGVCMENHNSRGQFLGPVLYLAHESDLTVLDPDVSLDEPLIPLTKLRAAGQPGVTLDRVRVQATVTLLHPAYGLFLQSGDVGLLLPMVKRGKFRPGDSVVASGEPSTDQGGAIVLRSAFARAGGSAPPPVAPPLVTPVDLLTGEYESQLVQVEAGLTEVLNSADAVQLSLKEGDETFIAELASHPGAPPLPKLIPGARLRLTGVCRPEWAVGLFQPVNFRILLRGPSDLAVTAPAPWSARINWFRVVSLSLLCTIAALAWSFSLRRKVSGRTEELASRTEELLHARDRAEEATRLKSQFLANMSHEIRTPMNGVLGLTELVLDSPLSAEQRDLLDSAQGSARGLLALLDDILDFSRIEAGKLSIDSAAFEPASIVRETVRALQVIASAKAIVLRMELSQDLPPAVTGDPHRLRQVLFNLVGNAIKFTDRGSVVVRVNSIGYESGAATLRFCVEDSGVGIEPEQLDRIFHPFIQADGSITRRFGGSGLGLAITDHLVKLMGGHIEVQSQPHAGSSFSFELTFPLAHAPVAATSPSESPDLSGCRVLLAEDNAVNLKLASLILERAGCTVITAATGLEAVAAFQQGAFDIILMDVQMPELDGLEATRRIRFLESAHHGVRTPIVALTAHALHGDRERTLAAGMDDYIQKPFRRAELLAKIQIWHLLAAPSRSSANSISAPVQ